MKPGDRVLIVSGTRENLTEEWQCRILLDMAGFNPAMVIHGGNPHGVDAIANAYCPTTLQMPAQWDRHGKPAGPKRNRDMAELGAILVEYGYDVRCLTYPLEGLDKSRGTRDFIHKAKAHKLDVTITLLPAEAKA